MNTAQDTWQPVALVSASLSNDHTTCVEVVNADAAVYLAATNTSGDSHDTRMMPSEARALAQALLRAADDAESARYLRAVA